MWPLVAATSWAQGKWAEAPVEGLGNVGAEHPRVAEDDCLVELGAAKQPQQLVQLGALCLPHSLLPYAVLLHRCSVRWMVPVMAAIVHAASYIAGPACSAAYHRHKHAVQPATGISMQCSLPQAKACSVAYNKHKHAVQPATGIRMQCSLPQAFACSAAYHRPKHAVQPTTCASLALPLTLRCLTYCLTPSSSTVTTEWCND